MLPTANLHAEDRLRLIKFVCSFVWADLEVKDAERKLVRRLVARLGLSRDDADKVEGWLVVPPKPEEVDPAEIPREHRELFLAMAREVVLADGEVDEEELTNLSLFEQLLRD